jgi:glycosyltransferase involved in cell wall biosynthesis
VPARAPIVSVAMKAYNHAPFVGQAIQSVLDQSFDDFELVVTDDGSTDATPQIIAAFNDERIRFERFTENRGIAETMHATLQRTRGDYIAILNSDDVALPHRLERQVAFLRAHPDVAAVFCVPQEIDDDGKLQPASGIFARPFSNVAPSRTDWLRQFFFGGNCLCAPSATIRRSAYIELGYDDSRLYLLADLDRWVRLLTRHEIYVADEPLVAFRWRRDRGNVSAGSTATTLRNAFESLQILRRYRGFTRQLLCAIFADDIAHCSIDTERPNNVWLADVALLGSQPWHRLFALETLFDSATEPGDFRRIRDLSGTLDIFGLSSTR